MRGTVISLIAWALVLTGCTKPAGRDVPVPGTIRAPAVAGSFYPADPERLRAMVRGFLEKAKKTALEGDLVALLVPHAGYEYSGLVAAHAYALLQGTRWDTVVIIGTSHRPAPPVIRGGVSVITAGSFATPLGRVRIDSATAGALLRAGAPFTEDAASQALEHSVETQLPFLQTVLGDFLFVPIVVGRTSESDLEAGAAALASALAGRKALLIASSDLSHYPSDRDARRVDADTLAALASLDPSRFRGACSLAMTRGTPGLEVPACGEDAILLTLRTAVRLGAAAATRLAYADSRDAGGPPESVVGYGAMAFTRGPGRSSSGERISPSGGRTLLALARRTLTAHLSPGAPRPSISADPELLKPQGAFVTLRKAGVLRGCVGTLVPDRSLVETVKEMTIAAASLDSRFPPVTREELGGISIEISVLSPLKRIRSVGEISLGTDGVLIKDGVHTGVFLPQVAGETGWDLPRFLDELCAQKAGLPRGCWKDPRTEIYSFTAQIFEE